MRFLRLLLAQQWVRDAYTVSEISEPYFERVNRGVLVLSRVPQCAPPARQPIDRGANLISLAVGPHAEGTVGICVCVSACVHACACAREWCCACFCACVPVFIMF